MSARIVATRAEPCASASPPTAAAEAVTKKPRRDRLGAVTLSMSRFGFDCSHTSNLPLCGLLRPPPPGHSVRCLCAAPVCQELRDERVLVARLDGQRCQCEGHRERC